MAIAEGECKTTVSTMAGPAPAWHDAYDAVRKLHSSSQGPTISVITALALVAQHTARQAAVCQHREGKVSGHS